MSDQPSVASDRSLSAHAEPAAAQTRPLAGGGLLLRHELWLVPLVLSLLAAAVYLFSNPFRPNIYDHFVWQAEAWLDGRFAIRWPVFGEHANHYLQDVMPLVDAPGFGLIPFPPLPTVLLLPFFVVFGLDTDPTVLAAVLGGVNIGLAWIMVRQLTASLRVALLATIFFAFGTVHWYAAMLGSTWFYAHIVAVSCLLLALIVALRGERRETAISEEGGEVAGHRRGLRAHFEPLHFLAGLLLGLGALARLPVIFAAPLFALVGAGGSFRVRALSAGLGAAIPLAVLLAYNVISTGHLFHPAYQWLYEHEYTPRPELIRHDWLITDPRYIPQNSVIMLAWPPEVNPQCGLALLDRSCPLVKPDPLGMSLLLTSPAYLLAVPLLLVEWRRRLVQAAGLALLAVAVVNLMHFSQGWVQFGYRFSNDFAPLALILVTLAIARFGTGRLAVALVGASVLVNAWGVYWGVALRW